MKRMILLGISIIMYGGGVFAQRVTYSYDGRGNVTKRQITANRNASKQNTLPSITDLANEIKTYFSVGPNPTQDYVTVKSGNKAPFSCHLYDSGGKLLVRKSTETMETRIDLTTFPSGIYLLVLSQDKDKQQYKIVKQ